MLPTRRATPSRLAALAVPGLALLVACTAPGSGPLLEEDQQALNAAANLDQCANGPLAAPALCIWESWINGNLNESKAHYIEGDSVPYRMRFSNLAGDASHVAVIEWDTSEGPHHALDYLTTWDRSVGGDPCTDVAGCSPLVYTTFAIPVDPLVAAGPDGLAGTADDIAQAPGAFELYGGTITGVSAYTVAGTYPSTTQTRLAVTFTASATNPVLAWGGHISLRANWRPELTAASIPGAPFHMRLIDLDGQGGNQDRSLASAAVYNVPTLTVIKHVVNDDHGTAVAADFQMAVTGATPRPAAFPGAEAGTLVTLGGEGAYAVAEVQLPGYGATYSADCTGTLLYDQDRTCTVTNNDDDDLCLGVTCEPAAACMEAGVCNPASGQCEYQPKAITTPCRAAAGACDVAEYCDGATAACPADAFVDASVTCREAGGVCDVAEQCTGASAACPTDAFVDASVTCREAGGVCDVAEQCTGATAACPADAFVDASVTCREAGGVCDVAETCTGTSGSCPTDLYAGAEVLCRADGGLCDVAEVCDGRGPGCPTDVFEPASVTCRASAGACDAAEQCTGGAAACPEDGFLPATTECRGVAGDCDVAEACTGAGALCPDDALAAVGTECRASGGACDVAEQCTGAAVACPEDAKLAAGTLCRGPAGACDLPEACDGVTDACTPDGFVVVGTECRASTNACDPAEACTGSLADCPIDDAADCALCGEKFYDASASGVNEDHAEAGIAGWLVELIGPMAAPLHATTREGGGYEFTNLPAGDYVLCERYPLEVTWLQTGPANDCYAVTLPSEVADTCELDFGNLCLGAGGGHTLGFWSNKNGEAALRTLPLALEVLRGLHLVTTTGADFDPLTYKALRPWLLDGTATNMASMLSVQLAAMELNVLAGYVDEDQLVYMPGLDDGRTATLPGYLSVYDLMTKANQALATERTAYADSPQRAYLEALKTGLDRANNNRTFVQPGACPATFPTVAVN